MSLSINANPLSMNAQRGRDAHVKEQAKLISRLTTGLRGISQAIRGINDASSMLQVADCAMASVTDSLQRLREMAVANGNGSYGDGDRDSLQKETSQLLQHITQVGEQTRFNGEAVFARETASSGDDARRRAVLDGLKSGWLSAAEDMIKKYYGLEGDGARMHPGAHQLQYALD